MLNYFIYLHTHHITEINSYTADIRFCCWFGTTSECRSYGTCACRSCMTSWAAHPSNESHSNTQRTPRDLHICIRHDIPSNYLSRLSFHIMSPFRMESFSFYNNIRIMRLHLLILASPTFTPFLTSILRGLGGGR